MSVMEYLKKSTVFAACAVVGTLASTVHAADNYPQQPITLIVGYAPVDGFL